MKYFADAKCEIMLTHCEIWCQHQVKWNKSTHARRHFTRHRRISRAKHISQIRQDLFRWKKTFVDWQRSFLERTTRLELATSTLARWRSTRWATSAFRISCHLFRNVTYYNGDDPICQAYFWIFLTFFVNACNPWKNCYTLCNDFRQHCANTELLSVIFRRSYVYVL